MADWKLAAVLYVPAATVAVRTGPAPTWTVNVSLVPAVTTMPGPLSCADVPEAPYTVPPKLPSNSTWLPNRVEAEIRSISDVSWVTSAWAAVRALTSLEPVLDA